MKLVLLFVTLGVSLSACSLFDGDEGPGMLPLDQLRSTPETLSVQGQPLVLRTFMWRDFQPTSSPKRNGLIAIFWVYSADSTALPAGLVADAAWVLNGDEIWDTHFTGEAPPPTEQQPYQSYEVAREGPKWTPGIEVHAVVRLHDSEGNVHFLRASGQHIERAD